MAAGFVATATQDYRRRFTAGWAEDNERRAAGQRAEQQRHADFLAGLTKDPEERENRETRERFAESQRRSGEAAKQSKSLPGVRNVRPMSALPQKRTFIP
jgi:hypothetical protein